LFSAEYVENQLWGSPLGCLVIAGKPRLLRIAVAESRSEIIINRRGSHRQDGGSHRQDGGSHRQAEEVTGKQRKSQASRGSHRQAEVVTGKMPVPQAEEKELASFIE